MSRRMVLVVVASALLVLAAVVCSEPVAAGQKARSLASLRAELLSLHNTQRRKAGKGPLRLNDKLNAAAQKYAEYLNKSGRFSHTAKGTPGSRVAAEGYRFRVLGENIAKGYSTPSAVVNGWMRSSGHRANILGGAYRDVGFGVSGSLWVVDFGAPR